MPRDDDDLTHRLFRFLFDHKDLPRDGEEDYQEPEPVEVDEYFHHLDCDTLSMWRLWLILLIGESHPGLTYEQRKRAEHYRYIILRMIIVRQFTQRQEVLRLNRLLERSRNNVPDYYVDVAGESTREFATRGYEFLRVEERGWFTENVILPLYDSFSTLCMICSLTVLFLFARFFPASLSRTFARLPDGKSKKEDDPPNGSNGQGTLRRLSK